MLVRAIGTPFRWRRRDHRKRFLNATEKEAARVALEQRDAQKAENKRDPPRVALARSAVIEGDQFRSPRGVSQAENKRKRQAKLREQVLANNEWAKKLKLRRQASGRKASGRRALRAAMAEARAEGGGKA